MQVITEWQPEKNGLTISFEKNSCFNPVFEIPMLSVVSTALIRLADCHSNYRIVRRNALKSC